MHVTFITPHVGRKDPTNVSRYVRTWQMEPLPMAILAGLTPSDIGRRFFDERLELIDFDQPTDLVAITVEIYTAKRAYEIAAAYRRRGVPTVLGGYHVMLMPDEASRYADAIVTTHAESVWEQVLRDAEHGRLQRRYASLPTAPMQFAQPDRSIYAGRNYVKLSSVETGRGCPLHCTFCAIMSATGSHYTPRPIDEIVQDIASSGRRDFCFVDDNIIGNPRWARDLFRALIPLKIQWFSQGSLRMASDPELLDLMAASGCLGVLIGFESFKEATLAEMRKGLNIAHLDKVFEQVRSIHQRGIAIYASFIFGCDADDTSDYQAVSKIAIDLGFFMAAFNPLIPFPGTPLYDDLRRQGRVEEQWWLSPQFRYGDIPFRPNRTTTDEIYRACLDARQNFYSLQGIGRRLRNVRGNLTNLQKMAAFFYINSQLRREITDKDGLPLGNEPYRPREAFDEIDLSVSTGYSR